MFLGGGIAFCAKFIHVLPLLLLLPAVFHISFSSLVPYSYWDDGSTMGWWFYLAAVQATHLPDCCHPPLQPNGPQQYWFSCEPISGSVSRSADVFLRAAMMDSCRDLHCEWLMAQRHLWRHWRMDLSSVIYHTACQCQYKCLMKSMHSPLNGTDSAAPQ